MHFRSSNTAFCSAGWLHCKVPVKRDALESKLYMEAKVLAQLVFFQ